MAKHRDKDATPETTPKGLPKIDRKMEEDLEEGRGRVGKHRPEHIVDPVTVDDAREKQEGTNGK